MGAACLHAAAAAPGGRLCWTASCQPMPGWMSSVPTHPQPCQAGMLLERSALPARRLTPLVIEGCSPGLLASGMAAPGLCRRGNPWQHSNSLWLPACAGRGAAGRGAAADAGAAGGGQAQARGAGAVQVSVRAAGVGCVQQGELRGRSDGQADVGKGCCELCHPGMS